ncbi:hypothetical protein F4779DRAFT_641466 [Xylariaceae sp. FL0662B]|nr:hypothetical protein F4779DRAFT_641466 [Xylariaceae sp. FL0662B]
MASPNLPAILKGYAEKYRDKYHLDSDGLLQLAEEMLDFEYGIRLAPEGKPPSMKIHSSAYAKTIPGISFIQLVAVLSDSKRKVPDWLIESPSALEQYTDKEMDIVILLIETRFWLGQTEDHAVYFWHWYIVWQFPRHIHRQMMYENDWSNLRLVTDGRDYPFVHTWSRQKASSYGRGFAALRTSFFPKGIDDVIVGFLEHCKQLKRAIKKLRRRYSELKKYRVVAGTELMSSCQMQIKSTEELMQKVFRKAKKWYREALGDVEKMQLPGAVAGLKFGEELHVNFDLQQIHVKVRRAPGTRRFVFGEFGNIGIRMKPGSLWCDWIRNVKQPSFAMMPQTGVQHFDTDRYLDTPGPVLIQLISPINGILIYFQRLYTHTNESQHYPPTDPSGAEAKALEKTAVVLSNSTGEPYWNVRKYRRNITFVTPRDYLTNDYPFLRSPIYDGAGNLQLSWMNGVLHMIADHDECVSRNEFTTVALSAGEE